MQIKKTIAVFMTVFFAFQMPFAEAAFRGRNIILNETQELSTQGTLSIELKIPAHHHFAKEVLSSFKVRIRDASLIRFEPAEMKLDLSKASQPIIFKYTAQPGRTVIVTEIRAFFCDDESQICLNDLLRLKFKANIAAEHPQNLSLTVPLTRKHFA